MRRLNPLIALLAALIVPLGCLMAATPAMASDASAIYKECEQNGQITGNFTRAELKAALNGLPSEVSEYSDCQDLIQQALLKASGPGGSQHKSGTAAAAGGKGGGGGSGTHAAGGANKTRAGSTQKGTLAKGSDGPVTLAGSDIRPGSTGTGAATSSLPAVLLVVLILLALTAVSGGAVAIRRRVVARQGT
jgi:hypothetical protein